MMAPAKEPVAFVGIGTMGHGMATSALRAGLPTIVWNRDPKATRDLADLGAEVAATPADAARQAGIVVTMSLAILCARAGKGSTPGGEIAQCLASFERLKPEAARDIVRFYRTRDQTGTKQPT